MYSDRHEDVRFFKTILKLLKVYSFGLFLTNVEKNVLSLEYTLTLSMPVDCFQQSELNKSTY